MPDTNITDTERLPSSYHQTRLVLMTRDPHWLFAYWELPQEKRKCLHQELGVELWEKTTPVLKITNVSRNKSFFVRINDFADNWYIHVDEPGNLYVAEIGRMLSDNYFINLASSNYVSTPKETPSINSSAFFADYKDLRNGNLNIENIKLYEELLAAGTHTPCPDENLAALFGAQPEGLSGISSASFLRQADNTHWS